MDPVTVGSFGELNAPCSNCGIARALKISAPCGGIGLDGPIADADTQRKALLADYLGNCDVAEIAVESARALRESGDLQGAMVVLDVAKRLDCSVAKLGWSAVDAGDGMSGPCKGVEGRRMVKSLRQSIVRERLAYAAGWIVDALQGLKRGQVSPVDMRRDLLSLRAILYDCYGIGLVPQQRRALSLLKKADALDDLLLSSSNSPSGAADEVGSDIAPPKPAPLRRKSSAGPKRSKDRLLKHGPGGRRKGADAPVDQFPVGAKNRKRRARDQDADGSRGSAVANPGARDSRVPPSFLKALTSVESLVSGQRFASAHQELQQLKNSEGRVIKTLPTNLRKRLVCAEGAIESYMQSLGSARRSAIRSGSSGCAALVSVAVMVVAAICVCFWM